MKIVDVACQCPHRSNIIPNIKLSSIFCIISSYNTCFLKSNTDLLQIIDFCELRKIIFSKEIIEHLPHQT